MNRTPNTPNRLLVVALSLAAFLLLEASGCGKKDLTFTVTFGAADNLRAGQKVTYKGVPIGEVTGVDLAPGGEVKVGVRIPDKNKAHVYKEAEFEVENAAGMANVGGEKVLEVSDRGSRRTPIKEGDIIKGVDSLGTSAKALYRKVRAGLTEAVGDAKKALSQLGDELMSSDDGKEMTRLLEELERKGGKLGTEGYEKLRGEYLPLIREKAEQLKKKMDEAGLADKAKEAWRDLQAAIDKAEK